MGTGDGRTGVPRIWLATTAVAPVSPCTSGRRVGYGVVAERAGLNCINYVCVCVCDQDTCTMQKPSSAALFLARLSTDMPCLAAIGRGAYISLYIEVAIKFLA